MSATYYVLKYKVWRRQRGSLARRIASCKSAMAALDGKYAATASTTTATTQLLKLREILPDLATTLTHSFKASISAKLLRQSTPNKQLPADEDDDDLPAPSSCGDTILHHELRDDGDAFQLSVRHFPAAQRALSTIYRPGTLACASQHPTNPFVLCAATTSSPTAVESTISFHDTAASSPARATSAAHLHASEVGRVRAMDMNERGEACIVSDKGLLIISPDDNKHVKTMYRLHKCTSSLLSVTVMTSDVYVALCEYGHLHVFDTRCEMEELQHQSCVRKAYVDDTVAQVRSNRDVCKVYSSSESDGICMYDLRKGVAQKVLTFDSTHHHHQPHAVDWNYGYGGVAKGKVFDIDAVEGSGLLAAVAADGVVRLWDANRGGRPLEQLRVVRTPHGHAGHGLTRVGFAGWAACGGAHHNPGMWVQHGDGTIYTMQVA